MSSSNIEKLVGAAIGTLYLVAITNSAISYVIKKNNDKAIDKYTEESKRTKREVLALRYQLTKTNEKFEELEESVSEHHNSIIELYRTEIDNGQKELKNIIKRIEEVNKKIKKRK